ncbi:MAG: multicopper oxidase domain-containing protein [Alphaproteobacteria bacterium]|nr:multicopper oxidase domain-containing protein [Alphaproteobacteria bacterium]
MHYLILMIVILLGFTSTSYAKVVEYKLNVNEQKVNISGKEATALTLNNSIPGPTLKAKVGDTLRIEVTNNLDIDTSIHWHGVLVPNNMDGVPYVNGPPIKAGETFTYEFPIKHSGTYWYHAHSALQEQQGVYGSLVFYPEHEVKDYDEEHVLVLSDWTDENPDQVLANLKKDSDYYALKKDSVQSWLKVLENGAKAVKIRINNAWTRMGPMDMSDIGYDAFLINGKKSSILSHAKPGARVKLRIINAAASSYFVFEYSGGTMKVIESDGVKVDPFTAQKIRIAMAETYDVIITIPENKMYEFRASAEDGTGYAVTHIGHGDLVPTSTYPKPNLVLMDMMGGMDHGSMGGHDMGSMPGNASHASMSMPSASDNAKMAKHNMSSMNISGSGPEHTNMNMTNVQDMAHSSHHKNQSTKKTSLVDKPSPKQKNAGMMDNMQDHSMHSGMKTSTSKNMGGNKEKDSNAPKHDMKAMEDMDHSAMKSMKDSRHDDMKMNGEASNQSGKKIPHVDYLNNYKSVKSPVVTTLPKENPIRIVTLKLTGSMERYVWSINDTPMYAADEIRIRRGENVKFILVNETMMNHPIHLHGHFFRVLNGQGEYSPLKHTVNVSPFETVEIEFDANEEKDWIFHCHNLYHMKLGMGGIVHYEGTKHDPALMDHAGDHSSEHGNTWFSVTRLEGYSNFSNATTKLMRHNDNFIADFRHNYKKDYEGELVYQRYVSQFLGFYVGGKFKREDGEISNRGIVGATYTLPLLIKADLRINTKGKLRFGLGNEHQLTDRVSFDWRWNTEKEYTLGLSYAVTKQLYISGNYDSRERFGLGLNLRF